MTFLAPALAALGLAVAVPLVLHLLQRHQGPRMVFPALRYLQRAEREHATRIRLRQVLLLALRVLALLLLAAAAARPFVRFGGEGHEPTSVVMILDNSLSSGAVVGDRRTLDELVQTARRTLEAAGPDDRFWLIRAGRPWEPAITGDPATVAEALRRTEPSGAAADLRAEVERAASILAAEPEGRAREIHLLSDLQRTGFERGGDAAGAGAGAGVDVPIRVLVPEAAPPANRAIEAVVIGGGLPPRADERSSLSVAVGASSASGPAPADSVSVRLLLDGSVRGVATVAPGEAAVLPFPARPAGLVTGAVELDADALTADDRRHFVAEVVEPPAVALTDSLPFLAEALGVLEEAGRIRVAPAGAADVVVAPGARGADAVRAGGAVVVLPPATPLELGAANQRLATAGIPWRFGPPSPGEARLDTVESELAGVLGDVRLRQVYPLQPAGPELGESGARIRLRTGQPWAVTGALPGGGRYAILATPFTPDGGTIPTSAAMLPLLDRAVSAWAAGGSARIDYRPGDVVTLPRADSIRLPDGGADAVSSGAVYRLVEPGVYRAVLDGRVVAAWAVNPPPEESDLTRLATGSLADGFPGHAVRTADAGGWTDVIYHRRLGREITWPLIAAALLVLLVETAVAATGTGRRASGFRGVPATSAERS